MDIAVRGMGTMEKATMSLTTGLAVMLAGVDVLREELGRSDLPSQTIACFCHVALRGEVPMFELIDLMGVSNAAVSRNVYMLSAGSVREPGLGLVEATEDPEYRRRKLVRLTPKGLQLAKMLVSRMNGKLFIRREMEGHNEPSS